MIRGLKGMASIYGTAVVVIGFVVYTAMIGGGGFLLGRWSASSWAADNVKQTVEAERGPIQHHIERLMDIERDQGESREDWTGACQDERERAYPPCQIEFMFGKGGG